jgi:hypothetical protein
MQQTRPGLYSDYYNTWRNKKEQTRPGFEPKHPPLPESLVECSTPTELCGQQGSNLANILCVLINRN